MYGVSFENVELERVAASIIRAVAGRPEKRGALSLCEEMLELNTALFENLKKFAANCKDADSFKAAMQEQYPAYSGQNYLDMTAGFFFA